MSGRATSKDHEKVFRVVVKSKLHDGSDWVRFHGPYATKGAAKGIATYEQRRGETKVQESVLDWKDVDD
jgi:hypothetical protein